MGLVCRLPSRSRRGQGDALDGAAGSVTNSALLLGGAASCCAALRAAALRCVLRAAPRCSGLVAPSGTRGLGNPAAVKRFRRVPVGGRPRDAAVDTRK